MNTGSAHAWDALPHHSRVFIDLMHLDPSSSGLAQQWLEELLSGKTQLLPFSPGAHTASLIGIYTSARNGQRKYGTSPLGLGFPFLSLKTKEKVVAAPLLIWPVVMEPEALGVDQWYLSTREQKPVMVNEVLCHLLLETTGIDWMERLKALGPRPEWKGLKGILQEIETDLDPEETGHFVLRPCPKLEALGNQDPLARIHISAVVGLFPQQAHGAFRESAFLPAPTALPWSGHPFGIGALDPQQASAAETIRQEKYTLVQGGHGSGKKFLAAHMLSNALSNGHKCLVISNSLFPIKEMQQRLSALGLGRLCFTLRNPQEDIALLPDFIRAEIQAARQTTAFDARRFTLTADKLLRSKDKLDKAYLAVRNPILGKDNWTNIVGKFLQSNRQEGKELLGAHLNPADFRFDEEEHQMLIQTAQDAFPLFQKIKSLDHPLNALHQDLFLRFSKNEALPLAEHKIKAYEKRTSGLLHRFISRINAYSDQLRSYLEDHHRKLSLHTDSVLDQIRDYTLEYGDDFLHAGDTGLQFRGAFSKNSKQIIAAREKIVQHLRTLQQLAAPLLEFGLDQQLLQFPKSFKKLAPQIGQFRDHLSQWRQELPTYVQEETLRLSAAHMHPLIIPGEMIVHLEKEMDLLLLEINEERLLQNRLEHQLLTLKKREKYLEQLLQTLETLRVGLRDFSEFYDWQRLWLNLPDNARKLLRALTTLKPTHWTAALQSWYLDQALLKHQNLALPQESIGLSNYEDLWQDLQRQLPNQILAHWQGRRIELQKKISRQKDLSAWVSGKRKLTQEQDPAAFFGQYAQECTEAFPVLFATTQAALELFRNTPDDLFEWVLFLDAQFLRPGHATALLPLGQRVCALANPLTQTAEATASTLPSWKSCALQTIHRLYGLNPIQLLMAEHIPDEAAVSATETQIRPVNGSFHEQNRINPTECDRILEYLLQELPQKQSWTAPSISVVTFTPEQRDYIAGKLLQLKLMPGQDSELVQQLERNGLGVYALDELEELHSDIVLVSLCFGPAADGSGTGRRFAELQTNGVLQQLHMLMGMSNKLTVFCHSLPAELLEQWSYSATDTPEGFLSNFLLLASDSKSGNSETERRRLERFAALTGEKQRDDQHEAFWDALAETIKPYIAPERIKRHFAEAQFHMPLVITPVDPRKSNLLLCADGFWGVTPHTDYIWEQAQRKMLSENGFQTVQVWSVNWWKQADQEARRLAGQLIRAEQNLQA